MNKEIKIYPRAIMKPFKVIFCLCCCLIIVSCNNDQNEPSINEVYGNSIYVTLGKNILASTRASYDNQDRWSVAGFTNGDRVGLYALRGNMEGDGSFSNVPMDFTRSVSSTFQFDNPELKMERSQFQADKTLLYYPYQETMEEEGMVLRQGDNAKCVDLLFMGNLNSDELNKRQMLSGNFNHVFSELIILRGEGFDKAKNKTINVVINKAATRVRFRENPSQGNGSGTARNMWKFPELYFDEKDGLNEEQSRSWEAWQGKDFKINQEKGEQEAYYVLIPNIYPYSLSAQGISLTNVSVDYIEIYDDNDILQKVTNFSFTDGTKRLENGKRYPIEIKMEGLVPTVYPYQILNWEDEEDITDERTVGINNSSEFYNWINIYNQYTSDSNPGEKYDTRLLEYGDKEISSEGKVTWHFYILNDINFKDADIDFKDKEVRITKLTDHLDGMGNLLSNLRLSDSLIGEISGEGCLSNMVIRGLSVINDEKDIEKGLGGVTNLLAENGRILKCDIDATISADCNVGIMAGSLTGATVEDCIFSGLLIGKGTSDSPYTNLIGLTPASNNFTLTNTNFSGIIFTQKTN